jgi:hypothetical protein
MCTAIFWNWKFLKLNLFRQCRLSTKQYWKKKKKKEHPFLQNSNLQPTFLQYLLSVKLTMTCCRKKLPAPRNIVVVHHFFGRGCTVPSKSPFPMKLETFLRMTKTPYMVWYLSIPYFRPIVRPFIESNEGQICLPYHNRGFHGQGTLTPPRHLIPPLVHVYP